MHSKITTRFVMLVATAAVAPLVIYGLISLNSFRSGNQQAVRDGNLNVARRAAEQIELYVQNNIKVLVSLAADLRQTGLHAWQQDRILKNHVLDFPEFRELTLLAADGTVAATSAIGTPRASIPIDYDERIDAPHIEPMTVDDDFLPTTTVAIRLTEADRLAGWLIGELTLEELWRMVDRIRVGAQGFALVVAREGQLIAHGNPDEKPRVATAESPDLNLDALLMAGSATGNEYRDASGRRLLGVATTIPSLGWTVVVEQPTSEAYALADELQLELVLVITLALLATIALGYYWGRSFIRPIFSLMSGTQAIAEGRLEERVDIPGDDEFHELGQAFNSMADRLVDLQDDVRKQERQAMFGRIAAGLVHDLSHPIQNIGNSCKLIQKLYDDVDYRETFQKTVDREFATIKRVLEDLRNLARPIPLEHFPVDVNRSVHDAVESMQPLAATAGLTIDLELSAASPFVEGDMFALGRVYRNLILNAIEATSPGGEITVSTEERDGEVLIRVADTGFGIPPDRLAVIFEDFKTTKRRGLGLGLAISKKIVDQLKGTITVESTVGVGTIFVLAFPRTTGRSFPTAVAAGS